MFGRFYNLDKWVYFRFHFLKSCMNLLCILMRSLYSIKRCRLCYPKVKQNQINTYDAPRAQICRYKNDSLRFRKNVGKRRIIQSVKRGRMKELKDVIVG